MKPPRPNEDENSLRPIRMPPKVVSVGMERMCQWEPAQMVSLRRPFLCVSVRIANDVVDLQRRRGNVQGPKKRKTTKGFGM